MKYTTVFFDLDDTLVDTLQNSKEALIELYAEYKIDRFFVSFEAFFEVFVRTNIHLWNLYEHNHIDKQTLKEERFKQALDGFWYLTSKESFEMNEDFLTKVSNKRNIIHGVNQMLEYLYPKYQLYILSNGFEEVQAKKLDSVKLTHYFKKIILSDHIGINKPDAQLFIHALNEAKISNAQAIVVGDNINTDIIGAKNSNIDQVWYNPRKVIDHTGVKPTYSIHELCELRDIL
jgi:putative hydrolase of the HAD superfamily